MDVQRPGAGSNSRNADQRAEHQALKLIARSIHSRSDLRLKLAKRGYEEPSINHALDRLEELGYLDDAEFARRWILSRIERKREGRGLLRVGLRRHGVPIDLQEKILQECYSEEQEWDALLAEARRLIGAGADSVGALSRRLQSRGFGPAMVRRAVEDELGLSS